LGFLFGSNFFFVLKLKADDDLTYRSCRTAALFPKLVGPNLSPDTRASFAQKNSVNVEFFHPENIAVLMVLLASA
jgi:hypothetical protein